ncbi:AIPR protein [Aneurinibacillus soli]|uniref:AIPR protein n=1 Tax=Aneurinibacillus soli TaxID=1500254 RepID=A0A0U5C3B9_9BACL|nr:AIPR family protein [Aneurinibacillus soli]PYE58934.1 AIPR protein [Aneurinibacillus soli]BAU26051.1 AIPR protein [Aneurinibacillus soli]
MALNKILSGMVKEFCIKNSFSDFAESKAYEYLVNYVLVSKMHPEAFTDVSDLERINVDHGSTFGIDGIAFIINDNLVLNKADIELYSKSKVLDVKILFIQTKTEESYDSGKILKTIEAAQNFFGDRTMLPKNNESIGNAIEIYEEIMKYSNSKYLRKTSPEVFIYFATAARPCEDEFIINLVSSQEKKFTTISPDVKTISIHLLGGEHVIESYSEVENRVEVNILFKNTLSLDKIEQVEQSYLGYLPCNEYLKIITDSQGNLRRRLFYENVRDYQGPNNNVNKEICETLTDKDLKAKFILLNNGVTIVAKHLKSLGSNAFEMRDFQIVNGCQTSNEVFNAKETISEVLIPVKIIHTTDPDLISMIVRATNRQTPVPEEAFIALEKYHKRLQTLFDTYSREMPISLHYERRSGELNFQEKTLLSYQQVNLHSLIRAVTSVYFLDPHVVYNNNPANILRNRRERLFQEDHKPEIYYLSNYLLAKFVELQNKKVLKYHDYKIRYYVIMVARFILSGQSKLYELNSKDIEKDAKKIIDYLKKDEELVIRSFVEAKNIVNTTIHEFKKRNGSVGVDGILRDSNFNSQIKRALFENKYSVMK